MSRWVDQEGAPKGRYTTREENDDGDGGLLLPAVYGGGGLTAG